MSGDIVAAIGGRSKGKRTFLCAAWFRTRETICGERTAEDRGRVAPGRRQQFPADRCPFPARNPCSSV